MAHASNRYKADLRDIRFALFEQFEIQSLLGQAPYEAWGTDECNMVLDEVYRFACEVTGPLNQVGDQQGCKIVDGRVITPDGFKEAWDKLYEAGWRTLAAPEDTYGQGAPMALGTCVEEMISGSNTAFAMYPGLCMGAAEVIAHFGTASQRPRFVEPMMNGRFGGTMCLTEPHAGSDVGDASTSATRRDDGRYNIKGTKIFISGGDSDLTENTVHLLLARIEGAEKGTKGLSLFVVPRLRVGEDGSLGAFNDVTVPSIEHKLGINGSATCVLQFGDNDDCIGELVGSVEHQGIRQMFRMMNFARIAVGIQGMAVASNAYLNTLEYARDRKQGADIKELKNANAPRVSILNHPNIRQDILDMKAHVEGIRALIIKLSTHQDRLRAVAGKDDASEAYHQGQIDLLTPIVKSYATDQAFRICDRAIQTYGGHGYLQDHPVEQALRDSKIFSIYEGTNAIQSLDLVSRKLGQRGGDNVRTFLADIQKFIDANKDHEVLGESVAQLVRAHGAIGQSILKFVAWGQAGDIKNVPLTSERFLNIMSELSVGWMLLEQAAIALEAMKSISESHPDHAFYTGKKYAAIYFAQTVLPLIPSKAKVIAGACSAAIDIPNEAFATL